MLTTARRTRGLLAAGLASAALLTACGGDDGAESAAPSSSASESTAEESSTPDLASGLLPADAFGPDASVVAVSPAQLQQGAGLAESSAEGLQIAPESCNAAVQGAQPSFDEFDDIAAQNATIGSAATVEVLVRGGPTKGAVDDLAEAPQRCPQAQVTSPDIGTATITFESLPVDDLGDGAALVRYTTTVTLPDGTQASVPALIGAVEDGDRLLVLMNLDPGTGTETTGGAVLDPAPFAALLAQAYETQAAALD